MAARALSSPVEPVAPYKRNPACILFSSCALRLWLEESQLMLECLRQALFQRTRIVAEFAFGLGVISQIRRSSADAQIFGSIQLRHWYDLLDDTHESGHRLHYRGRDGVAWGGNTRNRLGDMQDLDKCVIGTSEHIALAHHPLLHCENVATCNIIDIHPGEGRTCRDDRQFALQVQEKGRAYAARVLRT